MVLDGLECVVFEVSQVETYINLVIDYPITLQSIGFFD